MPMLFQYLFKLSCSLAVVALFYHLVLRRLTFYNSNRWYLLAGSLFSFVLPLADVSPFLSKSQAYPVRVVQLVPALGQTVAAAPVASASPSVWAMVPFIVLAGSILLACRLLVQYTSYRRLRRRAQALTQDGIRMYEVSENIVPFSFGNAIYINPAQHNAAQLRDIIAHEFVHVKERHTLDVLWLELVCILNWYNPAAWLLRHAVRQNLEFIADRQVLQSGIDKKEYQYLLLQVLGAPPFRIAPQFNFSSLKKRIVMMNKLKSAKAHAVKFLLVLPVVLVLLVAFRNATNGKRPAAETIAIAGMVVDAASYQPLSTVTVVEAVSKQETITDARGYFSMEIPAKTYPVKVALTVAKQGYNDQNTMTSTISSATSSEQIQIIGMAASGQSNAASFVMSANSHNDKATYEDVLNQFEKTKKQKETEKELMRLSAGSEKPYWVVDGRSFVITNGGSWASWDDVVDIVFVNGKRMTGEEVNQTQKRSWFNTASALGGESAQKKYGLNQSVFELNMPAMQLEEVAPNADTTNPEAQHEAFLKRNPTVRAINWTNNTITINLKNGKKETYNQSNDAQMQALEKKYGALPVAPPPPPPLPPVEAPAPPPPPAPPKEDSLTSAAFNNARNTLAQQKLRLQSELDRNKATIEQTKQMTAFIKDKQLAATKQQQRIKQDHDKEIQAFLIQKRKLVEADLAFQRQAQKKMAQEQLQLAQAELDQKAAAENFKKAQADFKKAQTDSTH